MPKSKRVPLPISFPLLVRLAWKQYVYRFDVVLFSHLVVTLPLSALVDLYFWQLGNVPLNTVNDFLQLWTHPVYVALQAAAVATGLIVNIVIIATVQTSYRQKWYSWVVLWRYSREYYWRAILLSLAIAGLTLLGSIAFIIPGIIIAVGLSLSIPALVWYDLSPRQAITYSWQLVKRHWWLVAFYLLGIQTMIVFVSSVLLAVLPANIGFTTIGLTLEGIFSSFATFFIVILFALLDSEQPKIPFAQELLADAGRRDVARNVSTTPQPEVKPE